MWLVGVAGSYGRTTAFQDWERRDRCLFQWACFEAEIRHSALEEARPSLRDLGAVIGIGAGTTCVVCWRKWLRRIVFILDVGAAWGIWGGVRTLYPTRG